MNHPFFFCIVAWLQEAIPAQPLRIAEVLWAGLQQKCTCVPKLLRVRNQCQKLQSAHLEHLSCPNSEITQTQKVMKH